MHMPLTSVPGSAESSKVRTHGQSEWKSYISGVSLRVIKGDEQNRKVGWEVSS